MAVWILCIVDCAPPQEIELLGGSGRRRVLYRTNCGPSFFDSEYLYPNREWDELVVGDKFEKKKFAESGLLVCWIYWVVISLIYLLWRRKSLLPILRLYIGFDGFEVYF